MSRLSSHNPGSSRLLALSSRAWPFEEARKLLERIERRDRTCPVLFETGYGPSGLPHIGTFGEVARTTMVRHAFHVLTGNEIPTRLLCFSDDMDGMRGIPSNVPEQDMLRAHVGKPLTVVPNPFETDHPSFGHHNNACLRRFLDQFGFDYEFASASECYADGRFDEMLMRMLERYDEVMDVMLPTLRAERRKSYAPFLPIHPETGIVMQVPIDERDISAGLIAWTDPDTKKRYQTPVTGGGCKAQWKPDWALRWAALGVDYEMSGKDHIDNMAISSRICRILGAVPPDGFHYELFLDENGQKISKSKGNGLTIDEWLRYASPESLSLFMYQAPRKAKRLHFDVIPRNMDDYISFLEKYPCETPEKQVDNPVWHIHNGEPPVLDAPVSFSMLLNLVSASNAQDKAVLWGFIARYAPHATPRTHPFLDDMVGYAIAYFHDFVRPGKVYRAPDDQERTALQELSERLDAVNETERDFDAGTLQNIVYDVGRTNGFENLRDWFGALYEVLLGQKQGPRFGSFIMLYGVDETRDLIMRALQGSLTESEDGHV